jgi:integrase
VSGRSRELAGPAWQESGLVLTSLVGTAMDAANVRRYFRRALAGVDGVEPGEWTPRELRHSFVSLLSDAGVPTGCSRPPRCRLVVTQLVTRRTRLRLQPWARSRRTAS